MAQTDTVCADLKRKEKRGKFRNKSFDLNSAAETLQSSIKTSLCAYIMLTKPSWAKIWNIFFFTEPGHAWTVVLHSLSYIYIQIYIYPYTADVH